LGIGQILLADGRGATAAAGEAEADHGLLAAIAAGAKDERAVKMAPRRA
jgi:hypothetical protein